MKVQTRWLIRRDMAEVLEIERESFDGPWTEEEFLCCLRQRNCIGMVAEDQTGEPVTEIDSTGEKCTYHPIAGFMIYQLFKSRLRIFNFAVSPDARRKAVGSQMVNRLIDKLSQQRRKEIVLEVRETNLAAQMFFKSHDFRAVTVLRDHYDDTSEDAYEMLYSLPSKTPTQFVPHNRISEFDAA